MVEEGGELKVFNPNKEIATNITLEILIRHRDALKQARTGELVDKPIEELTDNVRRMNQVRALSLVISSQIEMITLSRPIVQFRSFQRWKKKNNTDEKKEQNPFDEEGKQLINIVYDYFKLKYWRNFLKFCEQSIIEADKTKRLDDDFVITKETDDGEKHELTNNFFEMLEDLEDSYEKIYLIMLTNKIVSAGIEEDEELTYKQKEEEAVRRVVEA